jgi:hypothetical protein
VHDASLLPGQVPGELGGERVAGHRRPLQHPLRELPELGELTGERLPDGRGHLDVEVAPEGEPGARGPARLAARELLEIERVTATVAIQTRSRLGRQRRAQ